MIVTPPGRIRIWIAISIAALGCAGPSLRAQPLDWDETFAPLFLAPGTSTEGLRLLPLPDGGTLLTGTFARALDVRARGVLRLDASGARDPAFTYAGPALAVDDFAIPLDDGTVLIAHDIGLWNQEPRLTRLNRYRTDGSLDPLFAEIKLGPGVIEGFWRAADGAILLFGRFGAVDGVGAQGLVRLWPDGTHDLHFSPDLFGNYTLVRGVAENSDGTLVVTAIGAHEFGILRLRSDGSRDPGFSATGMLGEPISPRFLARPMLVQRDGRIILSNRSRLGVDGTEAPPIPTPTGVDPDLALITRIVELANGDLLAQFDVSGTTSVYRLTPEGAELSRWPANAFSGVTTDGGFITPNPSAGPAGFRVLAADGTLQREILPGPEYPTWVREILLQSDGKIIASGDFSRVNDTPRPRLARLLPTGEIDPTFAPPDSLTGPIVVLLDAAERLWISLPSPQPNQPNARRLARLNSDGSPDNGVIASSELVTGDVRLAGFDANGRLRASVITPVAGGSPVTELVYFDADTGARLATWPSVIRSGGVHPTGFVEAPGGALIVDLLSGTVNGVDVRLYGPVKLRPDGSLDPDYRTNLEIMRVAAPGLVLADGTALIGVVDTANPNIGSGLRTQRIDANGSPLPGFQFPRPYSPMPEFKLLPDGSAALWSSSQLRRWRADGTEELNTVPDLPSWGLDAERAADRSWLVSGTFGLLRLRPLATTGVTIQPVAHAVSVGQSVRLAVEIADDGVPTFQWQRDGADLPGETQSTLELANATPDLAGSYRAIIRVGSITYTSAAAQIRIRASSSRLVNFSARSRVRPGTPQIAGFSLQTPARRPALLRAVGYGMISLGNRPTDILPWPALRLYAGVELQAENFSAESDEAITRLADQLGAFKALPILAGVFPGMHFYAALNPTLESGLFTVHTSSHDGGQGVSLFEYYDAPDAGESGDVLNVSLRGRTEPGDNTLIGGFIIDGHGPATILLRAVGPELTHWDVPDVLADPQLRLFAGSQSIAFNDDWETGAPTTVEQLREAETNTGAFPLEPGSASAALIATLEPGAYTVHATGGGSNAGEVLLEIYVVDR